ncbi:MAG: phenylalanine--tRNA ligase subunit beta [Candidatus Eremiobacteraeota bacterium]|nr:phenylalanine--tRNA ligase subunit beta [Candidatus Eremiobacteraeota bacterium]
MRVPTGWLREYVDLPEDVGAIADRIAMLGFPVDAIETRPEITGVVVGTILDLEKHPNADRLSVARVEAGTAAPLTIVTAATNVAPGQTIAVATVGARLPQLRIEPRTMRGVASEGMMISADELALPAEWFEDGILHLNGNHAAPGTNAVELLGLDGAVLDVDVTTNRVDAMSMVGLARELAASYGTPLRLPSFEHHATEADPAGQAPRVTIESSDCARFVTQRFAGLRIEDAPAWMRVRLALVGQRPINNIVDVSNYVMLETGQPLHFYDAAMVSDSHLVVRNGRDGERLVTLDDVERTLSPQVLVIADPRDALGIAGIMGGKRSEVSATTRAILLEAANFNGARIRRAAKVLGLRTEAAARHEKTLAPALADVGAARAAQLLVEFGATAYRPHAFGVAPAAAAPIALRVSDVERLLGLALPEPRISHSLEALGFRVSSTGKAVLSVTPPPWRRDVSDAADLVEEVARIEGYDAIVAAVPAVLPHEISSTPFDRESAVAHTLAALRYREIITYSLHGRERFDREARAGDVTPDARAVEVRNPLSEEQRFLRGSLVPGILAYFADLTVPARVFEIGHVFERNGERIEERACVTFGFAAEPLDEPSWRDTRLLELKGDADALLAAVTGRHAQTEPGTARALHPGESAHVSVDGRRIGELGRIDPRLAKAFDVRLPAYLCTVELERLPEYVLPRYRPPSKYPGTSRDLALSVPLTVSAYDVEQTIAQVLGVTCTGVRVFDEYRGEQVGSNRKSLAVRVTLQRFDATITDGEADEAVARALRALEAQFGAVIRT